MCPIVAGFTMFYNPNLIEVRTNERKLFGNGRYTFQQDAWFRRKRIKPLPWLLPARICLLLKICGDI